MSGSTFPNVRDDVTSALLTRLPWHDAPPADELVAHWFAHFPGSSVEMPGATPLLEALAVAGIATALVSDGLDASRQKLARATGFDHHVRFVLSSEAAGVKKPDRPAARARSPRPLTGAPQPQCGTTAGASWSTSGVSLSLISLRRNGISSASTTPTATVPQPRRPNSIE